MNLAMLAAAAASSSRRRIPVGSVTGYDADWLARSTAPGVFFAENYNTSGTVSGWPNGTQANVVWENTIKRSGAGALRINILASSGTDPGSQRHTLPSTRGNGTETWYQGTIYTPEAAVRYKPTFTAGGQGGKKSMMITGSNSNSNNEVVVNNADYRGHVNAYYKNGSGFDDFNISASTPNQSSNFRLTTGIDAGTPTTITTDDHYSSRYGALYQNLTPGKTLPNSGVIPNPGDIYSQGFPDPIVTASGLPLWNPNGWTVVQVRVKIGVLGTASSEIDVWAGPPGGTKTLIHTKVNVTLGTENGGHTHIWLTPYDSNRDANSATVVDTFQVYTELIASSQNINWPAVA